MGWVKIACLVVVATGLVIFAVFAGEMLAWYVTGRIALELLP